MGQQQHSRGREMKPRFSERQPSQAAYHWIASVVARYDAETMPQDGRCGDIVQPRLHSPQHRAKHAISSHAADLRTLWQYSLHATGERYVG
jgi:hypothetical protein